MATQLYYIRPRFGDFYWDPIRAVRLRVMLEAAIQRRFPKGQKVHVQAVSGHMGTWLAAIDGWTHGGKGEREGSQCGHALGPCMPTKQTSLPPHVWLTIWGGGSRANNKNACLPPPCPECSWTTTPWPTSPRHGRTAACGSHVPRWCLPCAGRGGGGGARGRCSETGNRTSRPRRRAAPTRARLVDALHAPRRRSFRGPARDARAGRGLSATVRPPAPDGCAAGARLLV